MPSRDDPAGSQMAIVSERLRAAWPLRPVEQPSLAGRVSRMHGVGQARGIDLPTIGGRFQLGVKFYHRAADRQCSALLPSGSCNSHCRRSGDPRAVTAVSVNSGREASSPLWSHAFRARPVPVSGSAPRFARVCCRFQMQANCSIVRPCASAIARILSIFSAPASTQPAGRNVR